MDLQALGITTAFFAGMISFVSPCVLPLVPAYLSYVGNPREGEVERALARTLVAAACFVLGFSTIFVALGVSAQALGGILQRVQWQATVAGGALMVVLGLFMTGMLRLPMLNRDIRLPGPDDARGPLGGYLLGLAFAFGWTPCIGPVLGAILTLTAMSSGQGAILLGSYSAGLGVPFLLTALLFDRAGGFLTRLRRLSRALNIVAGVMMAGTGVLMITGHLQLIAIYLLGWFPTLGAIG